MAQDTDGHPILATANADGTVRLWDTTTGEAITERFLDDARTPLFLPRADGALVLATTGATDHTVRLWNAVTAEPFGARVADGATLRATGTHADGSMVLALGDPEDRKAVRAWHAASGRYIAGLSFTTEVQSMTLGRLGPWPVILATWAWAEIGLWKPSTAEPLGPRLKGHVAAVKAVAYTTLAGGQPVVVSGSDDTTVRLWNPATGQSLGGAALPRRVRYVSPRCPREARAGSRRPSAPTSDPP